MGGELAVFFVLLLLGAGGRSLLSPAAPALPGPVPHGPPPPPVPHGPNPVAPANVSPAPWPQVVPAGLPGFPGPGWTPDEPPPPPVVTRAFQLLKQLWAGGPGTFKTEQIAARWITFVATPMGSKRGVVAFRLASDAPANAVLPTSSPPTMQASTHAPAPAPAGPVVARTLRRGASGADVKHLQQELGIPADGKFGPATEAAVKAFQSSHGLTADGVVGPATWGALGSGVPA